jgi:hypothetical protein
MQVIPHPGQAGNDRQVIQQPWRGEHIKIVSRQKHLHPKEVEIRQRNCCFLHKINRRTKILLWRYCSVSRLAHLFAECNFFTFHSYDTVHLKQDLFLSKNGNIDALLFSRSYLIVSNNL